MNSFPPPFAVLLVAGATLAASGLIEARRLACEAHYDCDVVAPTVSMTLRYQPGRRVGQGTLTAAALCLASADTALAAVLHAHCVSPVALATNAVAAGCAAAALPALLAALYLDAASRSVWGCSAAWHIFQG